MLERKKNVAFSELELRQQGILAVTVCKQLGGNENERCSSRKWVV